MPPAAIAAGWLVALHGADLHSGEMSATGNFKEFGHEWPVLVTSPSEQCFPTELRSIESSLCSLLPGRIYLFPTLGRSVGRPNSSIAANGNWNRHRVMAVPASQFVPQLLNGNTEEYSLFFRSKSRPIYPRSPCDVSLESTPAKSSMNQPGPDPSDL